MKTRAPKLLVVTLCMVLPGCALVPNYGQGDVTHGSFPRQGEPFESKRTSTGQGREDTLDVVRLLGGWELRKTTKGVWILELSAAYKVREGGVFAEDGDKWMGFVTYGYRRRLRE